MSLSSTPPTSSVPLDAPMDRFTARRLATAIMAVAGYRVVRTYTAPADAGAYVIDVLDTITRLPYVVSGPQSWLDVRGASARERRLMVARNRFPDTHTAATEASDVAETPVEETAPKPEQETRTMTQSPPAPAAPGGVFNFAQWTTITRKALENAEGEIARLQAERGQLEVQLRQRQQEIGEQVAELRGTIKRLKRGIDVVDRPTKTPATPGTRRSAGPPTGPTAAKYLPIALAWAAKHGGEIRTAELGRTEGVPPSRFNEALKRAAERGEVQHVGSGHFRMVTT